jgi:predicted amidohydrolase
MKRSSRGECVRRGSGGQGVVTGGLLAITLVVCGRIASAGENASALRKVRVAAVQMRLRVFADESEYAGTIDEWTRRAARRGARLVVFPEDVGLPLTIMGSNGAARVASSAPASAEAGSDTTTAMLVIAALLQEQSKEVKSLADRHGMTMLEALSARTASKAEPIYRRAFAAAARRNRVFVAAGSCPIVRLDGVRPRVYNGGYVFDPGGKIIATVLKVNPIPLEMRLLSISRAKGHCPPVVETMVGRIGVAICYDCHFPNLIGEMAGQGIDILIDPRANPERWSATVAKVSHDTGLWRRVQENACYGIECFAVGEMFGIPFEGCSQIVAPVQLTRDGRGVVAQARTADREELVIADLDMASLAEHRRAHGVAGTHRKAAATQSTGSP